MIKKVRKVGDSLVITIPTDIVKFRGIKEGDYVSIPDEMIVKAKSSNKPKEGDEK